MIADDNPYGRIEMCGGALIGKHPPEGRKKITGWTCNIRHDATWVAQSTIADWMHPQNGLVDVKLLVPSARTCVPSSEVRIAVSRQH